MASRRSLPLLGLLLPLACGGSSGDGDGTGGGTSGDTGTTAATATPTSTGDVQPTGSGTTGGTTSGVSQSGTETGSSAGPDDPTTGTPPGETGSSTGDVCADAEVSFEPKIPTVYLLLDQSGSMVEDFGGVSRWQAVYDALLAPGQVVEQFESEVRFGMGLYTAQDADPMCPQIVEVAPALDNYAALESVYGMNQPVEDTPTGDSIDQILPTVLADPGDGTKAIVLATDGEPDTCAMLDPQNGQPEAVAAAANAYAQGVYVFIISVGSDITDTHAQDMANAGAGVQQGDPDAPFYKADDQNALVDAFQQIVEGIRECKFELNGAVADGMAESCTVLINGMPVPYDDPDGWQLNDPSEIELVGDACQAIQDGAVDIKITCTCGAIIPG